MASNSVPSHSHDPQVFHQNAGLIDNGAETSKNGTHKSRSHTSTEAGEVRNGNISHSTHPWPSFQRAQRQQFGVQHDQRGRHATVDSGRRHLPSLAEIAMIACMQKNKGETEAHVRFCGWFSEKKTLDRRGHTDKTKGGGGITSLEYFSTNSSSST